MLKFLKTSICMRLQDDFDEDFDGEKKLEAITR